MKYKITYNNFVVVSANKIDKVIFVKTYDKNSGKVFWFMGFDIERDLIKDVKRILRQDNKYPNSTFKKMFDEDFHQPETTILFEESGLTQNSRKVNCN